MQPNISVRLVPVTGENDVSFENEILKMMFLTPEGCGGVPCQLSQTENSYPSTTSPTPSQSQQTVDSDDAEKKRFYFKFGGKFSSFQHFCDYVSAGPQPTQMPLPSPMNPQPTTKTPPMSKDAKFELIQKLVTEMSSELTKLPLLLQADKSKLIEIVISTLDNKSKVNEIRKLLLAFQVVDKSEKLSNLHRNLMETKDFDISDKMMAMGFMTSLLDEAKPISIKHKVLINNITEVVKSNLNDDQKVEKITELLL